MCVGLLGGAATVVPAMLSLKAVSLVGSYVGSLAEMQELLAIARGIEIVDRLPAQDWDGRKGSRRGRHPVRRHRVPHGRSDMSGTQQGAVRSRAGGRVDAATREPSEDQREVIILRHYADMSFKEIAAVTNCSINTALGRMRYGLINLRKMMVQKQISL